MNERLTKWFTNLNALAIRFSKGRLGSQLGKQSILLLHTTGRKSGRAYSTPVAYFEYEGRYLLVGSNWGRQTNADWFLNLSKQPDGRIEVKGHTFDVHAHEAVGDEYNRLWQYVTQRHPPYLQYQKMVSRRIPVIVLERKR